MQILYHHRTLADGAEGIHIREMIDAFAALGHEVSVASLAPISVPDARSRFWGRLKDMLPQALFELSAVALNCVDYVRFRRLLRRDRPAVVYKRHANYDLGLILAAKHARIPAILEVNCAYSSPEYDEFEPLTFRALACRFERAALRSATIVIAVSTPLAEYLRSLAGDHPHLLVVPNGANPLRFAPLQARPAEVRARLGLGSAIVIGWAGILRTWHRLDLLLDAIGALPHVVLLVIGDGPDAPRLKSLILQRGLHARVKFVGRIAHDEMAHYIAAMDIAVAAGDQTRHASPMKLLEYMAMERAVVAPRIRNIEDIVDDGVDGLLFAPDDADSLTEVLRRLLHDPALRARLGQAARRKVAHERNWMNNAATALEALAASRHAEDSRG